LEITTKETLNPDTKVTSKNSKLKKDILLKKIYRIANTAKNCFVCKVFVFYVKVLHRLKCPSKKMLN
jgi:hypothetical protein